MKEKANLVVLALSVAICIAVGVILLLLIYKPTEQNNGDSSFYWLPDESYFVDYEIIGDEVKFRYAICFVNNSGHDLGVKLSAKFNAKSLKGWAASSGFLEGCDESGEWNYREIQNGKKIVLVYSFTTKYLGGSVNTKLPFPEEILLSEQIL